MILKDIYLYKIEEIFPKNFDETKYNEDISKYFDWERPDDTQYSYADDNWTPSLGEAKQYLKSKGFILTEDNSNEEPPSAFGDEDSAEAFYYIGRLIYNKGPRTLEELEEYVKNKLGKLPNIYFNGEKYTFKEWIDNFYKNVGKRVSKYELTSDASEIWDDVRSWHENKKGQDPNAAIVAKFWDWYKLKKAGEETRPDASIIQLLHSKDGEAAFGKYYKFACTQLSDYSGLFELSEEDMLLKDFWDWHRAKKNGKPITMSEETIDGMVKFLRTQKAVQVMQQYYYYAVRVIEKLSDRTIKTPINTDGLQAELKRIMDNLENDDFVKELEEIEINRLHGGSRSAGPVFVLPKDVIMTIRDLARDPKNVDKSEIGKIDKSQVKECYTYCNNELNRKFHIGKTGVFDLTIQDFYDTYKIVFQRGFNTKTLHKIFDEVCQYLLDQLDKGTADYWKNRGKLDVAEVDDFNESFKYKN